MDIHFEYIEIDTEFAGISLLRIVWPLDLHWSLPCCEQIEWSSGTQRCCGNYLINACWK